MHTEQKKSKIRIESIDYFRGLVALSVVAYHMYLFSFGDLDAETILGKFNTYRVSFFYILSGLTLYLVYSDKMKFNAIDLSVFYIKRLFRLVPLLWLATALTMILQFNSSMLSIKKIIANILVIPGAFKPETFIASGAWSIGDELFFYIFFPFIIFLARAKKIYLLGCLGISFLLFYIFGYYILDPTVSLGDQWSNYVHPLGQIFFFVSGISLGAISKHFRISNILIFLLFSFIFYLFATFPASGNSIVLITGQNRIILSGYTLILCFLFFKFDFSWLPIACKAVLQFFGNISYSLYLLHPIVYFLLKDVLGHFRIESYPIQIGLTVVLSIGIAAVTYRFFEQYYITLGKKFCKRLTYRIKKRSLKNDLLQMDKGLAG